MNFNEHCHFSRSLFTVDKHTYQLKRFLFFNSIPASYIDLKYSFGEMQIIISIINRKFSRGCLKGAGFKSG